MVILTHEPNTSPEVNLFQDKIITVINMYIMHASRLTDMLRDKENRNGEKKKKEKRKRHLKA